MARLPTLTAAFLFLVLVVAVYAEKDDEDDDDRQSESPGKPVVPHEFEHSFLPSLG